MNHPREAIWQARSLKDNGNVLFKAEKIPMAIEMYERAIQFLCAGVPICAQDAQLLSELAVTLNSNLAACWLRLMDFDRAVEHCDLAMRFDAYNVKVRYRRALAYISLDLVEDARLDLEIALKFEPKNKIVIKELKKLEEKFGPKAESSNSQKERVEGKKVFDPLSIHKLATKDHWWNSPREDRRGSVSLETFETVENEAPKDYPMEHLEEGNTPQRLSEGNSSESSFITSIEVNVEPRCPSGMDIDNQSEISSIREESLGEHPVTVGTSPAEQTFVQVRPKTGSHVKEEMICFSNPRRPNQYLRISRKAYNDLVNGRQLSVVLASKQERMDVRISAEPTKESTILEMCGDKDINLSEEGHSRNMGEEESDNASVITTDRDEVEISSMEWHPMETENKDEETKSPDAHPKTHLTFRATPKTRGRKHITTHIASRAASSNLKQVCKRIIRAKFLSFCRNKKEIPSRKRKSGYTKRLEDFFPKRICIASNLCNYGLQLPSLASKSYVSVCPDGASEREAIRA